MTMSRKRSKTHSESIVIKILTILEEKERIFETYKIASGLNVKLKTSSIIDFIELEMNRVIRVPLWKIYDTDPSLCELFCNAFFGRTKCWKDDSGTQYQGFEVDLWPTCRFHLYAGMLCMYSCVIMERLFKGVYDDQMARRFMENRSFFEQRTVALLNDVFRKNADIALNIIEIDYEKIFKLGETEYFESEVTMKRITVNSANMHSCWGGFCRGEILPSVRCDEESIELLAVAYRAKAMAFLAHNCCQSLIERRWHGRLRLSPTSTILSYLFPCFIYKEMKLRKSRGPEVHRATVIIEEAKPTRNHEVPPSDSQKKLLNKSAEAIVFYSTDNTDLLALEELQAGSHGPSQLFCVENQGRNSRRLKSLMRSHHPKFPVDEPIYSNDEQHVNNNYQKQGNSSITYDQLPDCYGKLPEWLYLTLQFYTTIKAKFVFHVVSRAVAERSWLCLLVNKYHRMLMPLRRGFLEWTSDHLFAFFRNMVIIVNCVTLSATVIYADFSGRDIIGWWAFVSTINDLIFHVSFLFAAVSMIRYLSVFYFFSVLTFMLKRMIKTLWKFLLIFVIFWMIFAVLHISMAENYSMRSNHSLAWMIFQKGAFEIFGEVDDGDKSGSLPGCVDITWMSVWRANSNDMHCLFRTTLVPITVFTYMVIASIMLVNLLTALLSKEYEEVSGGGSAIYWKYENYFLLATYEAKLWLPPPLSLLYYSFQVFLLLLKVVFFFVCLFCTCSSFFIIRKISRILSYIEGRPWGTLKQVRRHIHNQFDLEEVRSLVPKERRSKFHSKVRELIENSPIEKNAGPEECIEHAQIVLHKIFEIFAETINEEIGQIKKSLRMNRIFARRRR